MGYKEKGFFFCFFFFNSVARHWDMLPREVVGTPSLEIPKVRLNEAPST